jgi:UDP-N-acetylmuramate dehydrogenase
MKITRNSSLASLNTFGIDCIAEKLIKVETKEDLQQLYDDKTLLVPDQLILGGGSNILFTKPTLKQVVLIEILGINTLDSDSKSTLVRSGAGEIWDYLVQNAIANNLGGIENLSIIPGKVGAAPIQNIGAYGADLAEVFESLSALDLSTGNFVQFNSGDCNFQYRNSFFKSEGKGRYIITHVTLKLNKNHQVNISYGAIKNTLEEMGSPPLNFANVREAVIRIRTSKLPDPSVIGNAGSFFKNPVVKKSYYESLKMNHSEIPAYSQEEEMVKIPAAWLIEKCGWKGKRFGNAGVHKKQALVLVNYGNATGKEVYDLAKDIQISVNNEFGIMLEPEVNIV